VKPRSATVAITVPFHDIDSLGVVWHGHYAKYFELARCELLESFDYGYAAMRESGFSWPVIDLHVRYVRSIGYGQRIRVSATLREWEHRLLIDYLITDDATGERLTRGRSSQVAVHMASGEMCLESPPVLLRCLGLSP
jgi:acyl-CoA thioester hydrolase